MTDPQNPVSGVADDSIPEADSSRSGAVESSKGVGSSSLAEVLNRMARHDAPAACAFQGENQCQVRCARGVSESVSLMRAS